MKARFFRCVLAAFFAVACLAQAQEPEPERDAALPDGVVAQFSFAEPQAFLDGLYAYIDAATKGTGYYIPGEMLPMLAVAYSPVPLDVWDTGSELNILLTGDAERPGAAAFFRIGSFDELIEGLGTTGWEIGDEPAGGEDVPEPFINFRAVVFPNGADMLLGELPGGQAVLATDDGALRLAGGFTPGHGSDADFVARARADGPFGEQLAGLSDFLFEKIAGDAGDIVDAVVEAGLTEEAGRLLADMAAKYGRVFGEEIEQAEEIALELSFVGERLVVGLAALFADGAWTRRLAETIEAGSEGDFPDGTLLKRLPEGYFSAGVSASVTESAPDLEALNEALLADIAALAPEQKDALLAHGKALFAAGLGATASANYLDNGVPHQIALCEYDDAQAAIDAMIGMGDAFNSIAEKAFADPAKSVSFPFEKQSDGDLRWYAWRIEAASARSEGFGEFLSRIDRAAPGGMMTAGTLLDPDFRIYAARLENPEALLIVTGALGQEEFAAILRSVVESDGDAETPFDNPEVQTTAEALGAAQFSLGVMKPEALYLLFALQYAAATGRELPASSVGFIGEPGTEVVFGGGAEDGRVTARFALPATAVNSGVLMYEALEAALARAEDDGSGSQEDFEDETGDEAEESETEE